MYGQPPSLHLPYLPHESAVDAIDCSFDARELLLSQLKQHLNLAIDRMRQIANKHHSNCQFQVGDWVSLKLPSYWQQSVAHRSSEKISPRYCGPFQVEARVGAVGYTLALPTSARVHPTFHVSLLKHCPNPSIPVVHFPAASESSDQLKTPFAILDRRMVQKNHRVVTQVLVHWLNELPEDATWLSWSELQRYFPDFATAVHP